MINLDSIINEKNKEHNEKWLYLPDHRYIILIIGGSGSGKTNKLLNLIKEQDYHDVIDNINDPNTFIECSNTIDDIIENNHDYNPNRKRKTLIVFDDMIEDIKSNNKFKATTNELFIRCRKLSISLVSITQSYFSVPKDVILNSTHYLIMSNKNGREL